MTPRKYDVAIIGGGPAGLSAAAAAAKAGARTIVFEKQNEIGTPIHTSGGTWIDYLESISTPKKLYNPIRTNAFVSANREVYVTPPRPRLCVLDIRGFYQFLAEQATQAGADIRVKHRVESLIRDENSNAITGIRYKSIDGSQHELFTGIVIDASGFSRNLTVRAGLGEPYHRYGFGAEYDLYAPAYPQDLLYIIVGEAIAPSGYGWAFPTGNNRVRVGVGIIHPDRREDARQFLNKLMDLPQMKESLKGASPIEFHTGLIPSEKPKKMISNNGILLVGDAAGHASTLVGEGIRFAIESGKIAGQVAGVSIQDCDYSASYLRRFDAQWKKKFGRDMEISYLINQRMAGYKNDQWDRALDLVSKIKPDNFLQIMQADFSKILFLKILAQSPSLLPEIFTQIGRSFRSNRRI